MNYDHNTPLHSRCLGICNSSIHLQTEHVECLFFAFLCMEMVPSFSVAGISAGAPSFYIDHRQMHKGRVQIQGLQHKNRRLYLKLCTLYKIMHGYFYFPLNVFLPQVNRHSYSLPLVHIPHARTNAFKSSFVPSTVSIWNNLPHEALIAPTITSFKSFTAPLFLLL